jgi:hypothetical protein
MGPLSKIAIAAAAVVACAGNWLPNQPAARAQFFEHRHQLQKLIQQVEHDGFEEVHLVDNQLFIVAGHNILPGVPAPDRPEWAQLFREAEVNDVRKDEDNYYFGPQLALVDGVAWRIHVLHRGQSASSSDICPSAQPPEVCGSCLVPLTGQWYLLYGWFPNNNLDACLQNARQTP